MKKRTYAALTQDTEIVTVTSGRDDILNGAAFEMCDRLFDISFPRNIIQ